MATRCGRQTGRRTLHGAAVNEPRAWSHLEALYAQGFVLGGGGEEIPVHPAGVPRTTAEGLRDLVQSERPAATLEVGLGLGLSTLAICAGRPASHAAESAHLCIDPFQELYWHCAGVRALTEAGVRSVVDVLEEESQLALPRLLEEGRRFDFAFVDGDHRFESVFVDLYYADRLLEPGRVVVVDDCWMPAIRSAVSYLRTNLGYSFLPFEDLPAAFKRTRPRNPLKWRRHRLEGVAVLRKPLDPPPRRWDSFVPFTVD
jgi:predicted O-methyltransferase YrrM